MRARLSIAAAVAAAAFSVAGWSGCKDEAKSDNGGGSSTGAPSASAAPDVKLPGVDTSPLTPRERKEWSRYVSELLSPCAEVPVPISQCVLEKRDCPKCVPAAKFVLKLVQSGRTGDELERLYKNKFDPAAVRDLPLDGSPVEGPAGAKITIVEFADFQCPACQATYPVLEELMKQYPGQIRLVYKFIALQMHPKAEGAAHAAIAAMAQNKFWEMHHRLFETAAQDPSGGNVALDTPALEQDARSLGLDLGKFEKDMSSPATAERMDKDRKLFDAVHGDHTPTLFVNGRETDVTDLEDTLKAELGEPMTTGDGGATPAASGSAAAKTDASAPDASKAR